MFAVPAASLPEAHFPHASAAFALKRAADQRGVLVQSPFFPVFIRFEAVQRQMDKLPLEKLLKQAGKAVTPAMVKQLNAALNQIPRAE